MASMEIVFAHPRYEYPSYVDYRNLVSLASFQTCFIDQIDFARADVVYIVSPLNGEYRPHRDNYRKETRVARLVHWCLERPSTIGDFITGVKRQLDDGYFDYIWLSDRWLTEQVFDSRVRFVVLGSHEGLGSPAGAEKCWGIVHMSYETFRRVRIINQLKERDVEVAENAWGEERANRLQKSRFMLNVHQDDWPVIEPLRFSLAAAYALPLITERVNDAYPYTRQGEGHYVMQAEYHDLTAKTLAAVASDYEPFLAMGLRLRDAMTTEFEFGRQVKLAVEALSGEAKELVIR